MFKRHPSLFRQAVVATGALVFAAAFAALSPGQFELAGAQGSGACPSNPSPPDANDPSIIVDEPRSGTRITSPITVAGKARTFEANVQIRIFDEDQDLIVDTFTTAAEGAPALAPFSASVAFQSPKEQDGCVMVFEGSARDGSPLNVVLVPVVLAGSTAAPTPAPPDTGNAGHSRAADGGTSYLPWLSATAVIGLAGLAALARRRVA